MAINVRTDDVTGEVMAWGQAAFGDSPPPGQTDAALSEADKTDEALLNTYGPAYCTVDTGRIVADTLGSTKNAKVKSIRDRTSDLVDQGAVYEGDTYMDTDKGRFDVLGVHTLGVIGEDASAFPVSFITIDGTSELSLADATEFAPFFSAMIGAYRHWQATGQALTQEVIDATDISEVDAVTDDRVWPAPLMYFADGTFANSSGNRTIWANGVLHGPFAAGVRGVALFNGQRWYQSEAAATNDIDDSEDFSAWTSMGAETVVANDAVAPDGTTTADKITFTADAGDGVKTTIAGVTNNKNVTLSVWAKTASGTFDFRLQLLLKDGTTATSGNLTATTAWTRFEYTADILAGGTTPEARVIVDSVPSAGNAHFWGAQAEDNAVYASSYIPTAGAPVTRAADSLLFSAAQIPTVMREGKWKYSMLMQGTDAEDPPSGNICMDFAFGDTVSPTAGFYVAHRTVGRTQLYDNREAVQHLYTSAKTWSRQQTVTSKLDTVAGSLETIGATTGDGTSTGTSWSGTIFAGDGLYVGRRLLSAIQHPRGLISEPEAW